MAKGGHRRPTKRKGISKKADKDEPRKPLVAKSKKRQAQRSKSLLRHMQGMKWDQSRFDDELEELDDLTQGR